MKRSVFAAAVATLGLVMSLSLVGQEAGRKLDELETVLVTGEHPGPGLWKVSKGDHVMWVLGAYGPLPKGMAWRSKNVEARIAESQEVLLPPSDDVDVDVGFFRTLTLIPSVIKAMYIPDHKTLQNVLPQATWRKWWSLRQKYVGTSTGYDRLQPMTAIDMLRDKAYSRNRLKDGPVVEAIVKSIAKKRKVRVRSLQGLDPEMKIKSADIKAVIAGVREVSGVECFTRGLDHLEADLEQLRVRANAWATGDIEALRFLHQQPEMGSECDSEFESGVMGGDSARAARMKQLDDEYNTLEARAKAQAETTWMAGARKALEKNRSTFAVLPIYEVVGSNGYVAKLKDLGYEVEGQ